MRLVKIPGVRARAAELWPSDWPLPKLKSGGKNPTNLRLPELSPVPHPFLSWVSQSWIHSTPFWVGRVVKRDPSAGTVSAGSVSFASAKFLEKEIRPGVVGAKGDLRVWVARRAAGARLCQLETRLSAAHRYLVNIWSEPLSLRKGRRAASACRDFSDLAYTANHGPLRADVLHRFECSRSGHLDRT